MGKSNKHIFNYSKIYVACLSLMYGGLVFAGEKYEFDPSFLNSKGEEINIEAFNQGQFPAGVYVVDIFVNDTYKLTQPIEFVNAKNESGHDAILPCLEDKLLVSLGVKQSIVKKYNACNKEIPHAWKFTHNIHEQSLNINIPEADLEKIIDGVAPKIIWDDGINAGFVNYRANASTIKTRKNNDEQTYTHLDLAPGFNFGAWRFRNRTLYNRASSGHSKWQNVNNYVERGIGEIYSTLTIGDFITTNNLFNSLSLRGVGLKTDEAMIPGRLRNNTPVIRGVAKSPAYVEVEHNGYVIYTKNVDAGLFELDDLPNVGESGTYKVTVFESDGTKNVIMVPFTRAPLSLRKGFSDYAVSIGRYRGSSSKETGPEILDASYSYGLNERVTLLSGIQFSNIYEAYAAGVSLSLGSFGALSLEGTYAIAKENNKKKEEKKGGAVSIKYSKVFQETGTNLYLANHSYNSRDYRTLNEVYESREAGAAEYSSRKHSTSIGLNQSIGNYGGVRLSYNHDRYWNGRELQYFDFSYQGLFKGVSYSLGYNEYVNKKQKDNHTFSVNIRIPFRRENGNPIFTNYNYNNGNAAGDTHALGLSGAAFDNSLSWNINQKNNNNSYYGASGSAALRNQYGYISVGASTDRNSSSYSADIGGGVLFSRHGVTLGQEITQSTALLIAEGASDVPVTGRAGVKTNSQGHALVTNLQPYRENVLSLDPLETSDNVEILQTDIKVTPTKGAIVEGKFKTSVGKKSVVRLVRQNNKNVPFGSVVSLKGKNNTAGIVGDDGEVFLTGLPEAGTLLVKWGAGKESSCSVSFSSLPETGTKILSCQ
ncbi:fimbrial biogenesis outer membrane usher protein [Escherichia coli]|nr:fimbrial biogenesis outer membrane usher protein [Escherichia coli]